jgi:hypothetical protein
MGIAAAVTALSAGSLAVDAATMSVRGNDLEQSSASWDMKPGQEPLAPIAQAPIVPTIDHIAGPSLWGVRGKVAMDPNDENLQQLDQTIAQAKGAMAQIKHREDKGVIVAASEVSPALATNAAQDGNPLMIDMEKDPMIISGHLA